MGILWPIMVPAVLEEAAKLVGGAIHEAIEAFAWANRLEGAAVASVFWLLVILFGWFCFGQAKRGVKLTVAISVGLALALAWFSLVRGAGHLVPHKPLFPPLIRPQPQPQPMPLPAPRFPRLRGDEPPLAEPAEALS